MSIATFSMATAITLLSTSALAGVKPPVYPKAEACANCNNTKIDNSVKVDDSKKDSSIKTTATGGEANSHSNSAANVGPINIKTGDSTSKAIAEANGNGAGQQTNVVIKEEHRKNPVHSAYAAPAQNWYCGKTASVALQTMTVAPGISIPVGSSDYCAMLNTLPYVSDPDCFARVMLISKMSKRKYGEVLKEENNCRTLPPPPPPAVSRPPTPVIPSKPKTPRG